MPRGKLYFAIMGIALAVSAPLLAQEKPPAHAYVPDGMTSLRRNAVVAIGGEVRVDYSYQRSETGKPPPASTTEPAIDAKGGDLRLRNANLRIHADVLPNVQARVKLDFSAGSESGELDHERVLEEALVVLQAVAGSGLSFFAGKGRAPYGQDITLGMIQSYHHVANRADSSEGPILLNVPARSAGASGSYLPPMRPGQFDRVFLAGIGYERDARWRVEAAAFQPSDALYEDRLANWSAVDSGADVGFAARAWWRPVEELTLQFSGIVARSAEMSRTRGRADLDAGAEGAKTAYSLSFGFDWTRGPWRVFGEYQRAWDWNFTKGYDVDVWQLGAAREFGSGWRIGGMAEGMAIDADSPTRVEDTYAKLALNLRYMFNSGFFVLAEYGHEWFRREKSGTVWEKRRGDFFGVRCGLSF